MATKRAHNAMESAPGPIPVGASSPENSDEKSTSLDNCENTTISSTGVPDSQFETDKIGNEFFTEGTANDLDFVSKFASLESTSVKDNYAKEAEGIQNFDAKALAEKEKYLVRKLKDMPLKDYNFDDEDGEEAEVFKAKENENIASDADTKAYLSDLGAIASGNAIGSDNPYGELLKDNNDDSLFPNSNLHPKNNKQPSEAQKKKTQEVWDEGREETDAVPMKVSGSVTKCGVVHAHLDGVVVVKGNVGSRALDLGSLLCNESGEMLGKICDTFGKIEEPHYLVFPTSGLLPAEIPEKWPVGGDVCYVNKNASFAVDEDGNVMRASDFIGAMDEDLDECSGDESDDE